MSVGQTASQQHPATADGGAVPSVRWGLIGASDVAATRMIPAMRKLGHRVMAVGDPTPEWAVTYAERHGIPTAGSVEAVLDRDDVDAVYISTINDFHRTHTEAAAQAGKHVLCEKPLALSVDDGRAMLAACERAGVTLATNHHLPGSGIHRTIRRLVADGAVGRILAVRVFHAVMLPERLQGWRLGSRAGGGVAMDITCHDAAVLNPLLGALPTDVVALAVNQGPWGAAAEDALMSTLRYADGTLVQTHDAFTIAHSPTGLQVLGSDGSIDSIASMVQDPVGTIVLRDSGGEHHVEPADRRDLYEINVAAFAAALRGEGAPTVTGLEGLRAVQVALAVREAAGTGSRVSITD
jgi:1,5-anhydro-D-fructose reductase (1,5-anhydro-D-mannitol-forming)